MQSQWFVIHTLSGQEQKVKDSIEKRIKTEEMGEFISEVLVPMEKVVEVRNQKKTVTNRKLHPGYVYIHMTLLDDNNRVIPKPFYFVKETQGAIGFVGGEHPHMATDEEMDAADARIQAEWNHNKAQVLVARLPEVYRSAVPRHEKTTEWLDRYRTGDRRGFTILGDHGSG